MSAQEQMRKMLDELMGTSRNGENQGRFRFTDSKVCRSFLLNCCPHDILASTRADLGACSKHHDPALRADYEQAAKNKDYGYHIDATQHLQSFISDCDRRTEIAKKRLAETQESLSAEVNFKADNVHEMAEMLGQKIAEAEKHGEEGNVEKSMEVMAEVEEIRKKKIEAEDALRNSMPASTYQQQKLRVCEVCGAYLGLQDNDRRLADHFGGKLHLGFIEIREKLQWLLNYSEQQREERRLEREKEVEESDYSGRDRYRERRDRDQGDRDRDRGDRDRGDRERGDRERGDRGRGDRERGDRNRDRDRDRDSHRSRDRDRDRDGGDRDRDRERRRSRSSSRSKSRRQRRSRSRERRRSRSKSRDDRRSNRSRDRDRDRDRRRRSRSRDHDRRSRHRSRSGERERSRHSRSNSHESREEKRKHRHDSQEEYEEGEMRQEDYEVEQKQEPMSSPEDGEEREGGEEEEQRRKEVVKEEPEEGLEEVPAF